VVLATSATHGTLYESAQKKYLVWSNLLMIKIEPSQYHLVLPLVEDVNFDKVFAQAVIDQIQNGSIFVDNIQHPNTAFISHFVSGFSLLCGNQNNDLFNHQLIEIMLKEANTKPKQIRLVTYPDTWNEKLNNLLGDRLKDYSVICNDSNLDQDEKIITLKKVLSENVLAFERVRFKFNKSVFINRQDFFNQIPKGFKLKRIDEKNYIKITGKIIPSFSWDTMEKFLSKGIGYCLLKDEMVVSTSFSSFISNDMIDVGIETDQNFRGQGLGVYPAAAMIMYCLENGFNPIWGTNFDNIGSRRVANKLGYEEDFYHPFYCSVLK